MNAFLILAWGLIIGFCIVMYVILDGFTLGTGMLLVTMNESEKNIAMSMILPTWDGNQTWLVLGMASLYGAFPLAFSFLLPALYLPLIGMVIFLLFRGVAFEFRLKSEKHKHVWDRIFCLSSLGATLIQGYLVARLVMGFNTEHYHLWFCLLTAVGLVMAYSLLGSTRLILKTLGTLQKKMFRHATILMIAASCALITVCLVTPFMPPPEHSRWLRLDTWTDFFALPLLVIVIGAAIAYHLKKQHDRWPYWLSVLFVLLPYLGFAINLYPYAVPYRYTLWESAAQPKTLGFILVGAVIMLPVLLAYTAYAYHVFRGKTTDVLHY